MPFNDIYRRQVDLLVRTLPYVAEEEFFALKGGTAINLFVRDLPRLSVDIDLTYLPVADRGQSLAEIEELCLAMAERARCWTAVCGWLLLKTFINIAILLLVIHTSITLLVGLSISKLFGYVFQIEYF